MKKFIALVLCSTLLFPAPTTKTNPSTHANALNTVINTLIPTILLGIGSGLGIYLATQIPDLLKKIFAKDEWHVYTPSGQSDTFASVAGNEIPKQELYDIVSYLRNPEKYTSMGAHIPKGILLVGPPGNGKTLLARALAGEVQCKFIAAAGSSFVEKFVGTGAARIRALFKKAESFNAPCIIFIDEIDTIIQQRMLSADGHASEDAQTLNELLAHMDGFITHKHPIIVIGATNRPDILDPAAIRPGRFDRIVHVGLPNIEDREAILHLYAQKIPCSPTVNLKVIAKKTAGFCSAQLVQLINEALFIAINHNKQALEQMDLEAACDKLIMGPLYHNTHLSNEEKNAIAYHEAGHVLTHILLNPIGSTLHKVSILARGNTGGHTGFLHEERSYATKNEFLDQITICLGGRAAEIVVYNTPMTGSMADIYNATQIAGSMVCVYGMSGTLGPVNYTYNFAPETSAAIDTEIKAIMESCLTHACNLLNEHRSKLDLIAQALIEKEELSGEEITELLNQAS